MRPADRFFNEVLLTAPPAAAVTSVLVAHLLPSQPPFFDALRRVSSLAAVIPKPRSVHRTVFEQARALAPVDAMTREDLAGEQGLVDYLERRAAGLPVVLLDVGGYFSPGLQTACEAFSGQVLGVVEDTENGLRRYAAHDKLPCPVYSVARSPLKEAEDRLVGESIVFSTEALVRELGEVLPGRRACVIGYGKVGSSIARTVRARGLPVTVVERDPVRLAHALSAGFDAADRPQSVLSGADLVFCATGSRCLAAGDLARLPDGAFVATATSADDELDLSGIDDLFTHRPVARHISLYERGGRHFHLLNDGQAPNFLHGSALGPAIHLVQAEILVALGRLATTAHAPGLCEVPHGIRCAIADLWVHTFHPPTHPHPLLKEMS
ncbi:NAD-binding protein [Streptomyces sp. NPDC051173]|uniref:NAD-binding protein n=1 Tax=Streptomyces sp. NPDC051173 TaxID=3155164 RepID=UPI00344F3AE2